MNTNLKNITKGLVFGVVTTGLFTLLLYVFWSWESVVHVSNGDGRGIITGIVCILGTSVVIAWAGIRALAKRSIFWWSFLFIFIVTMIFFPLLYVK